MHPPKKIQYSTPLEANSHAHSKQIQLLYICKIINITFLKLEARSSNFSISASPAGDSELTTVELVSDGGY